MWNKIIRRNLYEREKNIIIILLVSIIFVIMIIVGLIYYIIGEKNKSTDEYANIQDNTISNENSTDTSIKGKFYLTQDLSTLEGIAGNAVEAKISGKQVTMPLIMENVARAFATKVSTMI